MKVCRTCADKGALSINGHAPAPFTFDHEYIPETIGFDRFTEILDKN